MTELELLRQQVSHLRQEMVRIEFFAHTGPGKRSESCKVIANIAGNALDWKPPQTITGTVVSRMTRPDLVIDDSQG